jgi:hypothetical protein
MSTNLAYSLPAPLRQGEEEQTRRRVRIVTTRAQRRARPKATYALVAIGVVFGIFMAQLLLTIALSGGAYSIANLQNDERDLGRVQSSLQEKINTLGSAQNLAANAQQLGMVGASTPAYLRASDGSVAGTPVPAGTGAPSTVANGSTDSVPNSLLDNVPVISGAKTGNGVSNAQDSDPSGTQSTGDTSTNGTLDPNVLPSPLTH